MNPLIPNVVDIPERPAGIGPKGDAALFEWQFASNQVFLRSKTALLTSENAANLFGSFITAQEQYAQAPTDQTAADLKQVKKQIKQLESTNPTDYSLIKAYALATSDYGEYLEERQRLNTWHAYHGNY